VTSRDHGKLICFCLIAYGSATALAVAVEGTMLSSPLFGFSLNIFTIALGLMILALVAYAAAIYGIVNSTAWRRSAGLAAAIFLILQIPLGTFIAGYLLWYHFGGGDRL
jgi:hypothetical protein